MSTSILRLEFIQLLRWTLTRWSAKREIQGLVHEISELSRSEVSPADFYDAMLNKVVAALAAPGGAVWTLNEGGGLQLAYQINLQQTGLIDNQVGQQQHGRLLHQVLTGRSAPPFASPGRRSDRTTMKRCANPIEFCWCSPVLNDQVLQGVIEIFSVPL